MWSDGLVATITSYACWRENVWKKFHRIFFPTNLSIYLLRWASVCVSLCEWVDLYWLSKLTEKQRKENRYSDDIDECEWTKKIVFIERKKKVKNESRKSKWDRTKLTTRNSARNQILPTQRQWIVVSIGCDNFHFSLIGGRLWQEKKYIFRSTVSYAIVPWCCSVVLVLAHRVSCVSILCIKIHASHLFVSSPQNHLLFRRFRRSRKILFTSLSFESL